MPIENSTPHHGCGQCAGKQHINNAGRLPAAAWQLLLLVIQHQQKGEQLYVYRHVPADQPHEAFMACSRSVDS
jgi:hypothetical protein